MASILPERRHQGKYQLFRTVFLNLPKRGLPVCKGKAAVTGRRDPRACTLLRRVSPFTWHSRPPNVGRARVPTHRGTLVGRFPRNRRSGWESRHLGGGSVYLWGRGHLARGAVPSGKPPSWRRLWRFPQASRTQSGKSNFAVALLHLDPDLEEAVERVRGRRPAANVEPFASEDRVGALRLLIGGEPWLPADYRRAILQRDYGAEYFRHVRRAEAAPFASIIYCNK